jgi:protein phosphatase
MHSPEATIYCANSLCQAPNPESHRFCHQCRSPLQKHYLWAVGAAATSFVAGSLLAERYLCKGPRTFLDIMPGLLPDSPDEVTEEIEAYLRLFPQQLHVPQVYASVPVLGKPGERLLLLEQAPIDLNLLHPSQPPLATDQMPLMATVESVWNRSGALRQLNWLRQMAQLWEPLKQEGVSSSLLNPNLLRTESGIIRLSELQRDYPAVLTLMELGQLWQRWQSVAHVTISGFMGQLCQQMVKGQLTDCTHLIAVLDQAIAHCSPTQARRVQLATLTDQGPTRQRNEDACYPPHKTAKTMSMSFGPNAKQGLDSLPMVVVCDGIGGHEGGNIASNLAITTVQQQLNQLPIQLAQQQPATLAAELGRMLLTANDAITQRNDAEHRHERQRMGTTLVMALGCAHELYLAHVGDSRAYRITRQGCYQITLDDDLASREVRLGYAVYRDALQQPNSGSLVQALGMNPSAYLHPTVQRFVMDEDCLFLLCSDGLSDNDRVEENWQQTLLPVLEGKLDVAEAAKQLLQIANEQNGHDNVTVGLLFCRVLPTQISISSVPHELGARLQPVPAEPLPSIPAAISISETAKTQAISPAAASTSSVPKTRDVTRPAPRSANRWLGWLLGFLALLGISGAITFIVFQQFNQTPLLPTPQSSLSPSPTATPPADAASLPVRSRVLVNRSSVDGQGKIPVVLVANPTNDARPDPRHVPVGTVLEITREQMIAEQTWLQLKVCSLPQTVGSTPIQTVNRLPIVKPGDQGWVQAAAISTVVSAVTPTADQLGQCEP